MYSLYVPYLLLCILTYSNAFFGIALSYLIICSSTHARGAFVQSNSDVYFNGTLMLCSLPDPCKRIPIITFVDFDDSIISMILCMLSQMTARLKKELSKLTFCFSMI